jgi:hypothetical protein
MKGISINNPTKKNDLKVNKPSIKAQTSITSQIFKDVKTSKLVSENLKKPLSKSMYKMK